MSSPPAMSRDCNSAKLTVNSTTITASTPPPSQTAHQATRSFLGLPTELRYMVCGYFTPEDQYTFPAREPSYDGLLRTCKQIRREAQKEIGKAADKYYRAYEEGWLLEKGFAIKVEPIIDPGRVTVILSQAILTSERYVSGGGATTLDSLYRVPLAPLNLEQLIYKVPLDIDIYMPSNSVSVGDIDDPAYRLMSSIMASEPQAQRFCFHWGTIQPNRMKSRFELWCEWLGAHWLSNRNERGNDGKYNWSITVDADYALSNDSRVWLAPIAEHVE